MLSGLSRDTFNPDWCPQILAYRKSSIKAPPKAYFRKEDGMSSSKRAGMQSGEAQEKEGLQPRIRIKSELPVVK